FYCCANSPLLIMHGVVPKITRNGDRSHHLRMHEIPVGAIPATISETSRLKICYEVANLARHFCTYLVECLLHPRTPASRRSFHTFAAVIGLSMCRTPRCQSASTTALTIAAGAPTVADSPTPFAPSGWCGDGVTVWPVSHFGVSTAVGRR